MNFSISPVCCTQFPMVEIVTLQHPSGATASVNLWGATVVSWKLPSGKEVFYLSPLSDTTNVLPIRGGIPLIFPQFGNGSPSCWILIDRGSSREAWVCAHLRLDRRSGHRRRWCCRVSFPSAGLRENACNLELCV